MKKKKYRSRMYPLRETFKLDLLDTRTKAFLNQEGWMLIFKPKQLEPPWVTIDTVDNVYKRLSEWTEKEPNYYSAVIYRPNGMPHRMFRNGFKAFSR